jgi:hypothetical protein
MYLWIVHHSQINQMIARKGYNQIKQNSMKYRITFQEDLMAAIVSNKNISHFCFL